MNTHISTPWLPLVVAASSAILADVALASSALAAPMTGRVSSVPLTGGISRTTVFKAGIRRLRGVFDGSPKLLSAVSSNDGNVRIVAFRASQHGTPVGGLSITTYDPAGNSRAAVLYDRPDRLKQSLPLMIKQFKAATQTALEKERPPAGKSSSGPNFADFEAAAAHVPLTRAQFPDGTASIGIAKGFTPSVMSGAKFGASAADGAYANLYIPVSILDPNSSLYQQEMRMSGGRPPQIPGQTVIAYDSDPVSAWKKVLTIRANERGDADPDPQVLSSAPLKSTASGFTGRMVWGTFTLHGEPFIFSGTIVISPPPQADGSWLLQIAICGAPTVHADTDMPALLAMRHSEKVDMNAVIDQTNRYIAASNAALSHWLAVNGVVGEEARNRIFQTSMHNAQVAQNNIDSSAAGFIQYINGTSVLAHDPTGAHGTLDSGLATALVKSDPQHFHIASLSEYIRGVDY